MKRPDVLMNDSAQLLIIFHAVTHGTKLFGMTNFKD